ncbi:MAG: AraC family transcriptional regulator [Spirochaetes bacterium]|nr:AraC family transcriptional regulator [Spirochaetota bacterium]
MIVRYLNVKKSIISDLIKDVWILDDFSVSFESHILLPVKEIDFMINFSGIIKYPSQESSIEDGKIFSNVIRSKPVKILQKGKVSVLGVSFNSFSYSALAELSYRNIINRFDSLRKNDTDEENTELFLNLIAEEIREDLLPQKKVRNIVRYFDNDTGKTKLEDLCSELGISCRTAERIFGNYIQMPPKKYMKLLRFRNSLNKVISARNESMTDIAYDCGYYDQSHFCDEFRSFTDCTPGNFLEHNNSVIQKMQKK